MREKATIRLIWIITGSILAAFLVPLAVRARVAPPRLVEAPARSASWNGLWQVSLNGHDRGMDFSPALAVQGNEVYAMWSRQVDTGDEDYDPYYNASTDNGDFWGLDCNIQTTIPTSKTASVDMALDSTGAPHFVWAEVTKTPYSYTLYYSSTRVSAIQQIAYSNEALIPVLAVGSTQVHVVWSQGDQDIMHSYKNISSGGWSSATSIRHFEPPSSVIVQDPSIVVGGTTVHVVWSEGGDPSDVDIRYKKNSGSWGSLATVYHGSVTGNGMGYRPDVAVSGSNVYVVWCAYKDDNEQYVRFRQSTNGGINWGSSSELISGSALAANSNSPMYLRPGIAVDINGKVHVVFNGSTAGVGGAESIFYASKTEEGVWRTRQNVTEMGGPFNNTTPAITTSGEYVHLAWTRQNVPPDPTTRYDVFYSRASIIELDEVFLPVILKSF